VSDAAGTEPFFERISLSVPAIAVHGGAGAFERVRTEEDARSLADGINAALVAGWDVLSDGGSALDAVVEAVASMEDSGKFNAGRSGARTIEDHLEMDAAVMDGASGNVGGVCATTWPRNPVRAALAVSALGEPAEGPILLAGAGADLFAKDSGLPEMAAATSGLTSVEGAGQVPVRSGSAAAEPDSPAGTVGAVAVDAAGHVAAATSTGGRSGQLPGRVGDSAIPGAGTWADDRTIAISATGEGESFVVSGFSHLVHWSVLDGSTVTEALASAIRQVVYRGGDGGAITVTPDGEAVFVFNTRAMARGCRGETETRVTIIDNNPEPRGTK
jgi:beta-aspartyl-peptidase (threonine type)